MATAKQIARCQSEHERWGYIQWHAYADRKVRQGHKQRFCAECRRWKFRAEQCTAFQEYKGDA